MTAILEKAQLMTRYFDLRALSSISATPDFKFGKVVWGNGYVNSDGAEPVLLPIPDDVSVIQGEFHRSDPILTYANNIITLRAVIGKGALAGDVNAEFNTLYLLDGEGNIIAVFAVQPIYMNKTRGLVVEGTIAEVLA